MIRPVAVVVCNALDDATRLARDIDTDSPAASRKVFQMCAALKQAGVRPYVLSLGRGRPRRRWRLHGCQVRRVAGVAVIYAPFADVRGLSEALSLVGLLGPLKRLLARREAVVIFYNRHPAYLPALALVGGLGARGVLDLEDGEVPRHDPLRQGVSTLVNRAFDRVCRHGALLACSSLAAFTGIDRTLCYYGVADRHEPRVRFAADRIRLLLSGTLSPATGAPLPAEAIRCLRDSRPAWADALCFEITGHGESLGDFERLAAEEQVPRVRVHGRTTDRRYREILAECDVGLALKPADGFLAHTTFPSKVVEFASDGLLVLSTDISDVRRVLGDGAMYLASGEPAELIELWQRIVADRAAAARCAAHGRAAVERQCGRTEAGRLLARFLFAPAPAP